MKGKDKGTCQIYKKVGHSASRCRFRYAPPQSFNQPQTGPPPSFSQNQTVHNGQNPIYFLQHVIPPRP